MVHIAFLGIKKVVLSGQLAELHLHLESAPILKLGPFIHTAPETMVEIA